MDLYLKNIINQLLFLLLFLCSNTVLIIAQSKYALLVGIGNYPEKSGWQKLSAHNDIQILEQTLLKQGFPVKNILKLTDKVATKEEITNYLINDFPALINSGDIAYVHFSGHGQQIADTNGDEIDAYDEAIVPYDSPQKYEQGIYEGENLIKDEELGQLLESIRSKLGTEGHLLVTLDACHSGTGTRGLSITRGSNKKMASAEYVLQNANQPTDQNSLEVSKNLKDKLAPIITFFSTSAGELSYEYKDENNQSYGLLSYTFSKALADAELNNYQALLEKIKLEMNKLGALQTPQAEGDLNQEILGGQLLQPARHFIIKEIIDTNLVLLNAGQLQGITKGTVIGFYNPNTKDIDQTKPIAKGIVTYSTYMDADVELLQGSPKSTLLNTWAMVITPGFNPIQLKLKIDLLESNARKVLLDKIAKNTIIQLVEHFPDLQVITNQDQLQLINKQDEIIFTQKATTCDVHTLMQQILNYAQANYLRSLEVKDKYISLEINLLNKQTKMSVNAYKIGETMQIQVKNTGRKRIYYQIIDIQPNNEFGIIIPTKDYMPEDFVIEARETQIIPIDFTIYPPRGNELFKIIATNQPIDLKNSLQTQNQIKANSINPFANLLKMATGKVNLKGEQARISIISKSFSIN